MSILSQLKTLLEEGDGILEVGDKVQLCSDEYESEPDNEDSIRPFFYGDTFIIAAIEGRIFTLEYSDGTIVKVLDKHIEKVEE